MTTIMDCIVWHDTLFCEDSKSKPQIWLDKLDPLYALL